MVHVSLDVGDHSIELEKVCAFKGREDISIET
jgi:hypothetical protein